MNNNLKTTKSVLKDELFSISNKKMSIIKKKKALLKLNDYLFTQKKSFLGYQVNQKNDYKTNYSQYLDICLNNIGDPFVDGSLTTNTKAVEREVLKYYAKLWNNEVRDKPLQKDNFWGYIVSMGATEANIFGILSGRDYLEGKELLIVDKDKVKEITKGTGDTEHLINQNLRISYGKVKCKSKSANKLKPISFYSQDAHYSIVKAMEVLKISTFNNEALIKNYKCPLTKKDYPKDFSKEYLDENGWPKEVPSNQDGSVHIPALIKLIEFFASRGHPILIIFNYGSTFKGAYDDIETAVEQIVPILKKYDLYKREIEYKDQKIDKRNGFWFHVDGALGAAYMLWLVQRLLFGVSRIEPNDKTRLGKF
ncbi:MAG: hypothetical protein COB17_05720 [Sulfurimonas sp.]|nr:MAG: hypothetical protein COB17_05720 [Sulfurimonas sp.]